MSYNPNFAANWDSRLIPNPELEEATEANQLQRSIAPVSYGLDGYQSRASEELWNTQNDEHQSWNEIGANTRPSGCPMPTPTQPTPAYFMPNAPSMSSNMIGPEAYHHSASNVALNHTGSFGASSVRASNAYNSTGHLMPPTSIQLDDHGASLNQAPMIPTTMYASLPGSPGSLPSMTEDTSRSSSYGPGTPGANSAASPSALNSHAGSSSTLEDDPVVGYMKWFISTVLPYLTEDQRDGFSQYISAGRAPPYEWTMAIAVNQGMHESLVLLPPWLLPAPVLPAAPILFVPTDGSYNGGTSYANATQGAHRRPRVHERRRYAPYDLQAATNVADLRYNTTESTGAALMGSVQSSSTGGSASLSPSAANAMAGPSTSSAPVETNGDDRRENHPMWHNPDITFDAAQNAALTEMFHTRSGARRHRGRKQTAEEVRRGKTCVFPGCMCFFASKQSRDRHVHKIHLKTLADVYCDVDMCGKKYSRRDAYLRHKEDDHGILRPNGRAAKEKRAVEEAAWEEEEEEEEEDVPGATFFSMPKGPRKDDNDDAGFGGMGGMFAVGSYSTLQA